MRSWGQPEENSKPKHGEAGSNHKAGRNDAPRDAVYTLHLTSDDGSVVRMSNLVIVDHDGRHGTSVQVGKAALATGLHPIEVLYFQGSGGKGLSLEITYEDEEVGTVPLGPDAFVRVKR